MIRGIGLFLASAVVLAGSSLPALAQSAPVQARLSGMKISLDTSHGIALLGIGDGVKSAGGRVFGVMVGERRVYSDEVTVREAKTSKAGVRIAFDLPDGLGSGVLELSSSKEAGVIGASLALTAAKPGEWRVLFPLIEKVTLDSASPESIEFFFPMQEGWVGRGEHDLSVTYGFRGWLPVLAAWNPKGTGIALQSRDATFTYRSLRFRNASDKTPATYFCDALDMAGSFPTESKGLSMSVHPYRVEMKNGQTWKSAVSAIQVYSGKQLFKAPFKSYGRWARATWWTRRATPSWLRDSFMDFAVHERVGNAGFVKGLYNGRKFICGEQMEAYRARTGGHAFVEWCGWWNRGEAETTGPRAGMYPMVGEGEYRVEDRWGGMPAYQAEVERCRNAGGRVSLYFLGGSVWKTCPIGVKHKDDWGVMRVPGQVAEVWSAPEDVGSPTHGFWDICSEVKGWQEFLRDKSYEMLTVMGADAVRMDTKCEVILCKNPAHPHADDPLRGTLEYMRTIRQGVDKAGADKALLGEFAGSDAAGMYFDAALAQGHDPDLPLATSMTAYGGISPFRWVYPDMKTIEWGNVPKDYHQTTRRVLFNGVGMTVSDLNEAQLAEMTRFAEAMRGVGDILGSLDCEPLVPTLIDGVYANRFSLGKRQVFTFWNKTGSDVSGKVIKIAGGAGRRFVDLLTGRELKTGRSGNADVVELALPVNEVTIVGVFAKTISANAMAGAVRYSAKPGVRLEVYDPVKCKALYTGDGEVTVAAGSGAACVRAVDGYLVQDCAEVKL